MRTISCTINSINLVVLCALNLGCTIYWL
uniref:Uncharacterized protein n=1 Tax=Anguilla anguilla TaxID=7936 RepID=A0A0E9Q580_ANGAN